MKKYKININIYTISKVILFNIEIDNFNHIQFINNNLNYQIKNT